MSFVLFISACVKIYRIYPCMCVKTVLDDGGGGVCLCVCLCVCETTFGPTLFFETCPEAHPCGRCVWPNVCILGTKWSVPNPTSLISPQTHTHADTHTCRVQSLCLPSGPLRMKRAGGRSYPLNPARLCKDQLFKMSS